MTAGILDFPQREMVVMSEGAKLNFVALGVQRSRELIDEQRVPEAHALLGSVLIVLEALTMLRSTRNTLIDAGSFVLLLVAFFGLWVATP